MIKIIILDYTEKTITTIWNDGRSFVAKYINIMSFGNICEDDYDSLVNEMKKDPNVEWVHQ